MVTDVEIHKLQELRELLFDGIEMAIESGVGHHKSYEGAIEISFPNYFDERQQTFTSNYALTIHCYVLGPNRHYTFEGNTLEEAINQAMEHVREWVEDEREWIENELGEFDNYIPTDDDIELIEKIDTWLENG